MRTPSADLLLLPTPRLQRPQQASLCLSRARALHSLARKSRFPCSPTQKPACPPLAVPLAQSRWQPAVSRRQPLSRLRAVRNHSASVKPADDSEVSARTSTLQQPPPGLDWRSFNREFLTGADMDFLVALGALDADGKRVGRGKDVCRRAHALQPRGAGTARRLRCLQRLSRGKGGKGRRGKAPLHGNGCARPLSGHENFPHPETSGG